MTQSRGKQQQSRRPKKRWHGGKRGGGGGGREGQRPAQGRQAAPPAKPGPVEGVLELTERGDGFLRDAKRNLAIGPSDPHVPAEVIRKFGLRGGEWIAGVVEAGGGKTELRLTQIGEEDAASWVAPPPLAETTAIDPDELLRFDTPEGPISMRVVEMFAPVGRGQRALIVAPPRTGKTILLQQMAHGISTNHPNVYMVVLLIDERPEEVTEMRRNVHGEVFASSNDREPAQHVRLARLVVERARRLVEAGHHIVILLDSITRLARAFNHIVGSSGRTMTGGLDIKALQEPKQIFGAARRVEGGGSLTIIASALVETGSRADDFIFQEFKGTGNMELKLDRELANLRLWPAIDLPQSGTRKEEKLLPEETLRKVHMLRRQLHDMPPAKQIEMLQQRMGQHPSLDAFLDSLRA